MFNYFEENEYSLDKIWFDYLGVRFKGRGLLTWNPKDGFHLEAFLENKRDLSPTMKGFGGIFIIPEYEYCKIRMKSNGFKYAIAPRVPLYGHIELIFESRLSIDIDRILFYNRFDFVKDSKLSGKCVLKTSRKVFLPDTVETEVKLLNETIKKKFARDGIYYKNNEKYEIKGTIIEENHLEIDFNL